MSATLADLQAFKTSRLVERVNRFLARLSAFGWDDGAATGVIAEKAPQFAQNVPAQAELELPEDYIGAAIQLTGFYQDLETKKLRLAPLFFYPNLVWAGAYDKGSEIEPPPNSRLWARVRYHLIPGAHPIFASSGNGEYALRNGSGWSGGIASASVQVLWSAENLIAQNQIFPGTYGDSMPRNRELIIHTEIGTTNADSLFSMTNTYLDKTTSNLIPPL